MFYDICYICLLFTFIFAINLFFKDKHTGSFRRLRVIAKAASELYPTRLLQFLREDAESR